MLAEMLSDDQDLPSDPESLIAIAAIVESSCGAHLGDVMRAADCAFNLESFAMLNIADGSSTEPDQVFNAELKLQLDPADIDVREDVPQQVASQLRQWADQLLSLADKVATVSSSRFTFEPRAYLLKDRETGDITEGGAFYHAARMQAAEHFDKTGHSLRIVSCPLAESPEAEDDIAA